MADRNRPKGKRRPKDPRDYHGHQIVTGTDLGHAFSDDGTGEIRTYKRRIFHGIILTLLIAAIIAAVLVALAIMRGDITFPQAKPSPTPTPTCPTQAFSYPPPKQTKVRVFNSTRERGLAGRTAKALEGRGFTVTKVGNKELPFDEGTAVIMSGPKGEANAFSVQRNIPGAVYVPDLRTNASVDVIVGSDFTVLVAPTKVDHTPGPLHCRAADAEA